MKPYFATLSIQFLPGHNYPESTRHIHEHHEWILATKGRGTQLTPSGESKIKTSELFFFPAGQAHNSLTYEDEHFDGVVISFDENHFSSDVATDVECRYLLKALINKTQKSNKVPLSNTSAKQIRNIFECLSAEYHNRSLGYWSSVKAGLINALVVISREADVEVEAKGLYLKNHKEMIDEVKQYVLHRYMTAISIDEVLAFCPLSRSHFHAVFKKEVGMTFTHYVNKVRIDSAKALLTGGSETILQLAHSCGFNNASHFCHTFQKFVGFSPREYRLGVR